MDISAAGCAADRSLCPLPPQAETPIVPGQKPQSGTNQHQVEIKNRTLVFSPTASGESSGNLFGLRYCFGLVVMYVNESHYISFVCCRMFSGGGESWGGGEVVPVFICSSICQGALY